ncbi:MAG TPA: efflux RND transporter periplasmic adaptor subunit [Candidatus Limnocylindrales bacterium]|nr:efflux RND transporter periplasmic adaptor subunit [Candidatus Limnocylindrales bacterium]
MATAEPKPSAAPERVIVLPSAESAPPKKRRIPQWAIWIALVVLAVAAWQVWRSYAQQRVTLATAQVERGAVQASINATGTLNPVVSVQVGSQVSGNIKALYADFNTKVEQGQLVALIDPQIFQAQVDQARGAATSAHSAAVAAEAQVEKARADLAGAAANKSNLEAVLAKDRANALNAGIQWDRAKTLFREGVMSQQDHDTAKAAFDASQAQITADESQIEAAGRNIQAAQAQVNVARTQLLAAKAQASQADAALRQANISLEHTRILAPVSGTVIARYMDVGQTVAASFQAPTIFNIAQDLTKMQVDTNVDESDIGGIRIGQTANFTVDAYPGTRFSGQVTDVRKAPINTQNVITYDVVVAVSNPDIKLFPGMTANVTVLTSRVEDAIRVPNAALRFRPSSDLLKKSGISGTPAGPHVYLLSGNKIKPVAVKLGISDGKFTAATSSPELKAGDQLVIRATSNPAASSNSSGPGTQMPRGPRM